MPFNRDSNSYIIIFVAIMVGVVAISLAFVSSSLQPTIKENERLDKKTQILSSVIADKELLTKQFVDSEFQSKIEQFLVDSKGNVLPADAADGASAFEIDFRKEIRKPESERRYPLFKYTGGEGESFYIMPLEGQGLWDRIWGYIAFNGDFKTIHGTSFGHKGETPGLGALITEDWFTEQFNGKTITDDSGRYAFEIKKGQGNELDATQVDGISGATITAQGVDVMLKKCYAMYEPYFEKNSVKN